MSEPLDELERLAHAATPGPRRVAGTVQVGRGRRFTVPDRREDEVIVAHVPGVGVILVAPPGGQAPSADARLMAALDRETVLALIARVRELEADRDRLAAEHARLRGVIHDARQELTCNAHAPDGCHYCPNCDNTLDSNGDLRASFRAALAEAPTPTRELHPEGSE